MLRISFLKAVIGDMVQHLDWPVGGYAGRSSLCRGCANGYGYGYLSTVSN